MFIFNLAGFSNLDAAVETAQEGRLNVIEILICDAAVKYDVELLFMLAAVC